MQDIIRDIQDKLQQHRFPNEASISQGIVLRLVRALGWNVDDIDVVWPEFSTGTLRADFALCHPAGKPQVLIEVKQPGTMTLQAEEQLAQYAFREGVPLVVLTSGQDWHFFAPYGPGAFSDRRIYRLDLMERTPDESSRRLERYLSFSAWLTGQANVSVQTDLQEMLGIQETRRRLPEAWETLLAEPAPELIELLTAQLGKQTGSEPPQGEVVNFLRGKSSSQTRPTNTHPRVAAVSPAAENPRHRPRPTKAAPRPRSTERKKRNTTAGSNLRLQIQGKEVPVINGRDRMIKAIEYLAGEEPDTLEKLHKSAPQGRRPGVAESPEGLYPKSPDFAARRPSAWTSIKSVEGWYLDLNRKNTDMENFINLAISLSRSAGKHIKIG